MNSNPNSLQDLKDVSSIHQLETLESSIRGHSVQISDGYVDNMMTLYRLRRPSGRPPDYTLCIIQVGGMVFNTCR
jgi:hypothetical protein